MSTLESATLCGAFQQVVSSDPDALAITAHGENSSLTRAEYARSVEEVAAGLAGLGVHRGDTVGLMLTNSPEFHVVDTAALHLGATPFSLYNTSSAEQITFLVDNADCEVLVTERVFLDRILASDAPSLKHVVVVDDADTADSRVVALSAIRGRAPEGFDFDETWRAVRSDDVATLIYTSGTTGPPKGVELTHANLSFVLQACGNRYSFDGDGASVSYLPTAHVADRVFSHYLFMATGWPVTTVRDASQVFAAVAACRPTWFLGVPRIWEKLRSALLARFASASPDEAEQVQAAIELATTRVRALQRGEEVSADLESRCAHADAALFAPLRSQLGLDRASNLMTGAAPIAPAVHEFFLAVGLPLAEGFGMSETGALGLTNEPNAIRVGSVGTPMPGTEACVADDGELLTRGPHVMRGYRKDPEGTAAAIDSDGWLHTGDVATIDPDGFFRIVDRKKELIINAAGKNMSPANIENVLKSASPLIGQACVIGEGRPYNVALIALDAEAISTFDPKSGGSEGLRQAVQDAVDAANARLSRIEQIKRFALLDGEWLPDSDELSPTMKLRRKPIAAKYAAVIDDLYAEPR